MADSTDDLRDQLAHDFAMQKLQAFYDGKTGTGNMTHSVLAESAYSFADQMMAARARRRTEAA